MSDAVEEFLEELRRIAGQGLTDEKPAGAALVEIRNKIVLESDGGESSSSRSQQEKSREEATSDEERADTAGQAGGGEPSKHSLQDSGDSYKESSDVGEGLQRKPSPDKAFPSHPEELHEVFDR